MLEILFLYLQPAHQQLRVIPDCVCVPIRCVLFGSLPFEVSHSLCATASSLLSSFSQFCRKRITCFFRAWQVSHCFFYIIHSPWSKNHHRPMRSRNFNHRSHYAHIFLFDCLSHFFFFVRGAMGTLSPSASSWGGLVIISGSSSF